LHEAALRIADQEDLAERLDQWIRHVVREAPQREQAGYQDERVDVLRRDYFLF
jgi:hypothetical protein